MFRKSMFLTIAFTVLIIVGSCSKSEMKNNSTTPVKENDYERLKAPNNHLAFKLLTYVEPDEQGNIFVSPTSLIIALSMAYNGADGETKEEIANVLQIGQITKEDLNRANASLLDKLTKQTEQIELLFANSVWLNEDFHFQDQFANDNRHFFDAEISEINITDSNSVKRMNDWVNKKTKGKIDEIVQHPLSDDLVTILLNALYFQGDWMYEFDESLTEDKTFIHSNDQSKKIPFMTTVEKFPYIENDVFQAISLPYNDGEMTMDIFLPREEVTIEEFKDELVGGRWEDWNRQFKEREGTILLPKFELHYEVELNDALKEFGMNVTFTEDAQFPHMIVEDEPILISKILQKTYIDVHETGTEAAGVTSVEIGTMSTVEEEPFYMDVNRPFFFFIKDSETNMILFTGLIENPN